MVLRWVTNVLRCKEGVITYIIIRIRFTQENNDDAIMTEHPLPVSSRKIPTLKPSSLTGNTKSNHKG